MKSLRDLLKQEIKELYVVESQWSETLPKMMEAAMQPALKQALEAYSEINDLQMKRLELVVKLSGISSKLETSHSRKGTLKKISRLLKDGVEPQVRDTVLLCMIQKMVHQKMVGYGTARYVAQMLGEKDIACLLEETEDEEKAIDRKLNTIAKDNLDGWTPIRSKSIKPGALIVPFYSNMSWLAD